MGFISIQEASDRTGKSQPTITRLARKNERTKHIKREDRKFFIDEEFLFRQYPEVTSHDESLINHDKKATSHEESPYYQAEPKADHSIKFIERLEDENNFLKKQLEKKDQQITHFQERQKELHYLLNHQTKLLESVRSQEATPEQSRAMDGAIPAMPDNETGKEGAMSRNPGQQEVQSQQRHAMSPDKIIYIVLAIVAALLILSILFVDELRALAE